jgi:hypothetical protein
VKNINDYGKRYTVEIYFSGIIIVIWEIIRARKPKYMIQEVGPKVFC